jgi:DNA-binding MltR family transcriptional regulator
MADDIPKEVSDVISEELSKLCDKVSELRTKAGVLITLTDSHHAIIAAAELDNALQLAILAKMCRLSSDMKERIFDGYGPLNNFAAKIDIAYALGIIPHEFYESLRKINKIRVKFAHSKTFLNFQYHEISAIIDSLPNLDLTIADRKGRFLKKIGELKIHLGIS